LRNQGIFTTKRAAFVLSALITWAIGIDPAHAQTGTAVLTGVVVDNGSKKPLEGVAVTATSPSAQGEQIAVTDRAGVYRIPNLPPGEYALRFDRDGYYANERSGFTLRGDITVRINAGLARTDEAAESIKVVQKAATVDVGSSSTGANLNAEFVKRVPVSAPGSKGSAARSFESVAAAAPNAAADTFGTSISGSTSPENHYVLDGLGVNNPGFGTVGTPLSSEFVKEVNVVTAGYLPEYGRATGGILNVITKQGSNELHGNVFSFVSPGGLEGARKSVSVAGQTVQYAPQLSYIGDVGGDLGGPLLEDKLWFYLGFDVSNTRYSLERSLHISDAMGNVNPAAIPGTVQDYPANLRTVQGMAKLTWQVDPDNRLSFAAYGTPTTSGADGQYSINPGSGLPEIGTGSTPGTYGATATRRYSKPFDALLKWSSEFLDKRLVLDTMLGIHHQSDGTLAADGSSPGSRTGYGSLPGVLWRRGVPGMGIGPHQITDFESVPGNACVAPGGSTSTLCPVTSYYTGGPDKGVTSRLSNESHDRYHGSVILTYFLNGLGHHLIKAGVDTELTTFRDLKSFWLIQEAEDGKSFQDVYHFGILTGPDQAKYLNPITVKTKSLVVGGFLQDSWSVLDKAIVNLGVRYDAQYLYGSTGALAIALPNQWSPRLGLIYDPTQSGRAKVFVNYARYFENAPLALADVALAGEPHALRTLDAAVCKDPGNAANQQACNSDAPLLKVNGPENPNRKYATIGQGGAPVDPDIKPASTDEVVAGAEYELFPDARVGLTYTRRWVNRWIEDVSRDNMNTFFLANPGFGIAGDFPRARRNYDALTLYGMKAFSNNWLAQVSYTLSWLRGNMFGMFRPETGDLLPNYSSDWDLKYLMDTRDGPLTGDHRHVIKAFGSKDWALSPRHHIGTGIALSAQSGGPTNYIGSDPLHGPREAYILPRGSGERLPWLYNADVQVAYRVALSRTMTVSLTVDVFNVLNLQGTSGLDEVYTESDVYGIKGGTRASIEDAQGKTTLKTVTGGLAEKNPNFGKPNAYQSPRVFRFGVRGEF
jgi:hypothetical protein